MYPVCEHSFGGYNEKRCQCVSDKCKDEQTCNAESDSGLRCAYVTECTNIDKTLQVPLTCDCGSARCEPGQLCDANNNACSDLVDCTTGDGSAATEDVCICGSNVCNIGQVCTAADNLCATPTDCVATNGSAFTDVVCNCGSAQCGLERACLTDACMDMLSCAADSVSADDTCYCIFEQTTNSCFKGQTCASADGTCSGSTTLSSCTITDGETMLPTPCKCGTDGCYAGNFCDDGSCNNLPLCPSEGESGGACKCGSEECTTGQTCASDSCSTPQRSLLEVNEDGTMTLPSGIDNGFRVTWEKIEEVSGTEGDWTTVKSSKPISTSDFV